MESLILLKRTLTAEWLQTKHKENKQPHICKKETREEFLKRIETLINGIIDALDNGEAPVLQYVNYRDWDTIEYKNGEYLQPTEKKKMSYIRYDDAKSLKKFSLIIKVLSVIYKQLQENKFCTKRDLYYQDPEAFGKQNVLDGIVDNIAAILDVPRWELNVLASCKGAIAGDLQFCNENGLHIDCRDTKLGVQVPAHKKDMVDLRTEAQFLLIVEKDATFQKLIENKFCEKHAPCILITAKGFPDLGTRLLLRLLWEQYQLPMFALVDCDPHGFEIMAVYRFGSKAHASENHLLTVPAIKWLGILPSEIPCLNIPHSSLIKMTSKDQDKTAQLLTRPYVKLNWKMEAEIQKMFQMGYKAEIQCLDSLSSSYLCDVYLPCKIANSSWI
ncbi:hypothetical protein LOTGIDRAFT_199608 [Lottia gigantea]|uniref:DNA topoisomerase (ATP-hydrolyzing) n=1 Tax=Lottia gigantea TaxID=225164 RepID=V4AEX6_LOTGI|nr:hypothetical protein LOTGIDRAFT_199608 [Lottia gigantea]ESP02589.1 hypothetical protein LOTGIDRAFT_199608 [Lottia gigantea]